MWLLTAYIIKKLAPLEGRRVNENEWELSVNKLIEFIFSKLWKEAGVALNDSIEELEGELRFLAKLRYIEMDGGVIITKDKLSVIAEHVEKDPMREKIPLWNEYIERIDRALLGGS